MRRADCVAGCPSVFRIALYLLDVTLHLARPGDRDAVAAVGLIRVGRPTRSGRAERQADVERAAFEGRVDMLDQGLALQSAEHARRGTVTGRTAVAKRHDAALVGAFGGDFGLALAAIPIDF